MTTAGTICQFIDRVEDRCGVDGLNMILRFVIIDMATCAIGLVDSKLPINSSRAGGVTVGTSHIDVLTWVQQ